MLANLESIYEVLVWYVNAHYNATFFIFNSISLKLEHVLLFSDQRNTTLPEPLFERV